MAWVQSFKEKLSGEDEVEKKMLKIELSSIYTGRVEIRDFETLGA